MTEAEKCAADIERMQDELNEELTNLVEKYNSPGVLIFIPIGDNSTVAFQNTKSEGLKNFLIAMTKLVPFMVPNAKDNVAEEEK